MKFLSTLFVIATISTNPAHAFILICTIKPVTDNSKSDLSQTLPKNVVESWLPPEQAFAIDLNKKQVTDLRFKRTTNLEVVDGKRFKWKYLREASDIRNTNFENIIYKYTYIQKTKKLFVNVDFGGSYLGVKSTRPKCVES